MKPTVTTSRLALAVGLALAAASSVVSAASISSSSAINTNEIQFNKISGNDLTINAVSDSFDATIAINDTVYTDVSSDGVDNEVATKTVNVGGGSITATANANDVTALTQVNDVGVGEANANYNWRFNFAALGSGSAQYEVSVPYSLLVELTDFSDPVSSLSRGFASATLSRQGSGLNDFESSEHFAINGNGQFASPVDGNLNLLLNVVGGQSLTLNFNANVLAEIAPVPLPAPLVMLLSGLAGVFFTGHRRRTA